MPLIKSKSKKAFEHNLKAEMASGKPQNQALAISYSVKRKAKKASGGTVESGSPTMNMAKGGDVKSAANESRPTTQEENNDRHEIARQGAAKALDPKQDATSPKNRTSALKGMKTTPLKHPKMVPQNNYSTRLRDEEDDLQASASTNEGPQHQPPAHDDEDGPNRQGPKQTPTDGRHMATKEPKIGRTPDRHMMSVASPSEDEGSADAHSKDEEDQNRQGPAESSTQGKTGLKLTHGLEMMAGGGGVDEIVPDTGYGKIIIMKADGGYLEHEMRDEHDNSIAAAIMAKKRMASGGTVESGSPDMNYADGGHILSEGATDTHEDTDQADLRRNAQEDQNHEDQLSFDALRKENYNESEGLAQMDSPMDSNETGDEREDARHDERDMVDAIRRKMKSRRQMPQE